MITKFVDRERELKALNDAYKKTSFSFYPIYGRRRVGKTELIKQFIKDKPHIYFLATEGTEKENILNFKNAAKNVIDLSFVKDDFEEIFKYIIHNIDKKTVIVIDEFPFLLKANKSISSLFQSIIDLHLSDSKNISLILCGSSVGMMYKEVLDYKAPLYGRRTGQIELKPFFFKDVIKFLNKPVDECVKIYGVCGGVPFYLKEFVEKKDFFHLIEEKVLSGESVLNKETIFLLREELGEISRYASIIGAISLGYTKLGEIMNHCGFKDKLNIAPYLHVLGRLGIVEKETSITSGMRARGIYNIKDEFFRFYFRYVRPNESILENDGVKNISALIKNDYNTYLGRIFERISKELLLNKHIFQKMGRWWYKENEIDIIGLNPDKKQITFFECKYKNLTYNKSLKILEELKEKTPNVKWHNDTRMEQYGLIAKKIENKSDLRKKGFLIYDLDDWK